MVTSSLLCSVPAPNFSPCPRAFGDWKGWDCGAGGGGGALEDSKGSLNTMFKGGGDKVSLAGMKGVLVTSRLPSWRSWWLRTEVGGAPRVCPELGIGCSSWKWSRAPGCGHEPLGCSLASALEDGQWKRCIAWWPPTPLAPEVRLPLSLVGQVPTRHLA